MNARFCPIEGLAPGLHIPLLFSGSISEDATSGAGHAHGAETCRAPALMNAGPTPTAALERTRLGYDGMTGNSAGNFLKMFHVKHLQEKLNKCKCLKIDAGLRALQETAVFPDWLQEGLA